LQFIALLLGAKDYILPSVAGALSVNLLLDSAKLSPGLPGAPKSVKASRKQIIAAAGVATAMDGDLLTGSPVYAASSSTQSPHRRDGPKILVYSNPSHLAQGCRRQTGRM